MNTAKILLLSPLVFMTYFFLLVFLYRKTEKVKSVPDKYIGTLGFLAIVLLLATIALVI